MKTDSKRAVACIRFVRWLRVLCGLRPSTRLQRANAAWCARAELHAAACAELAAVRDRLPLLLGALDSLGTALSDHGHEWSVGEREIYDQSVAFIEEQIAANVQSSATSGPGGVQ